MKTTLAVIVAAVYLACSPVNGFCNMAMFGLNWCFMSYTTVNLNITTIDYCDQSECALECLNQALGDCYLMDPLYLPYDVPITIVTARAVCANKEIYELESTCSVWKTDCWDTSGASALYSEAYNAYGNYDFGTFTEKFCAANDILLTQCLEVTGCMEEVRVLVENLYIVSLQYAACNVSQDNILFNDYYHQHDPVEPTCNSTPSSTPSTWPTPPSWSTPPTWATPPTWPALSIWPSNPTWSTSPSWPTSSTRQTPPSSTYASVSAPEENKVAAAEQCIRAEILSSLGNCNYMTLDDLQAASDSEISDFCGEVDCNVQCYVNVVDDCNMLDGLFYFEPEVYKVSSKAFCHNFTESITAFTHCTMSDATCLPQYTSYTDIILSVYESTGGVQTMQELYCNATAAFKSCVSYQIGGDCTASRASLVEGIYMVSASYSLCEPQDHWMFDTYNEQITCTGDNGAGITEATYIAIIVSMTLRWLVSKL